MTFADRMSLSRTRESEAKSKVERQRTSFRGSRRAGKTSKLGKILMPARCGSRKSGEIQGYNVKQKGAAQRGPRSYLAGE